MANFKEKQMKKRPETDWEFIIEDAKTNPQLRRLLEEVIKDE